jgi:hypothetical protein
MGKNYDSRIDALRDAVSTMAAIERDQPITPDMTIAQAEVIHVNFMKRGKKRARASAEAASKLTLTPAEEEALVNRYVDSLRPSPELLRRVEYAYRLVRRWDPRVAEIPATQRGPQIGRLKEKLVQLRWAYVDWIINAVATRLVHPDRAVWWLGHV